MSASFPSQNPSYPMEMSYVKTKLVSQMEDGVTQVRPKFTKGRRTFKLQWNALPETQYQDFEDYFEANQGKTFSWTDPFTTTSYTVYFVDDELKSTAVSYNLRRVSVTLQEA